MLYDPHASAPQPASSILSATSALAFTSPPTSSPESASSPAPSTPPPTSSPESASPAPSTPPPTSTRSPTFPTLPAFPLVGDDLMEQDPNITVHPPSWSVYTTQQSQASQASQASSGSSQSSLSSHRRRQSPVEKLDAFLQKGCGCKLWKKGPCYRLFSREHYISRIDDCAALTHDELDLVILAQIMAHISKGEVVGPDCKHAPTARKRTRVKEFHHEGVEICKKTFLILHGIGNDHLLTNHHCLFHLIDKDRFQALKKHYLATGLTVRQHGNSKRLPANTLTYQEKRNMVKFLLSYAEDNAILLPGRVPGYKRDDLQLLPSSTKKKVVKCYNFQDVNNYFLCSMSGWSTSWHVMRQD